jgi:PleD family two-component response regulator
MAGLHLSFKESKNNSNDNDYKKNSSSSSGPIPRKEESNHDRKNNDDDDKPLAKLLVVDDDSDIVHVLKQGLLKNRFLVNAFTNPEEALQSFKSNAETYCQRD